MLSKFSAIALLTFFLLACANTVSAQGPKTDSILGILNRVKEDSNKVVMLNKLFGDFIYTRPEKSIGFARQALALSQKLNWEKGIANSYHCIGHFYLTQGDYPKCLEAWLTTLKIREKIHDKKGIALANGNIGIIYYNLQDFDKTLEYYFKALELDKELGNDEGVARHMGNIGNAYTAKSDYDHALNYLFQSLELQKKIGGNRNIASCLDNLGNTYQSKGDYANAMKYYLEALQINEKYDLKDNLAICLGNVGSLYFKQKKFKEAEMYFKKSLALSEELGDLEGVKDINNNLFQLYSELPSRNYEQIFKHYKDFIEARDSISNEENIRKLTQTEMNYEFAKKEAVAKAEQERKDAVELARHQRANFILIIVSAILILLSVFAFFIFRSLKITKAQKLIIEGQKSLVEQKQKEILDSINYAERIQKSFLATKELLDENLKEYFVFFQPKDIVSGDFYWASKLNNGQFALVTADSTGHGVPGAIMSILNISSLERTVERGISAPAEILNHTRVNIIERLKHDGSEEGGKDGMDCSLISFDLKAMKFTYSAANNPVWIVRKNAIVELTPDKMPVGKHDKDNVSFSQHEVALEKGDMVYAITDGLADQFGGHKGKKFMYKQLKQLLVTVAGMGMTEQKQELQAALDNWKGSLEQVDDICIIGVRV